MASLALAVAGSYIGGAMAGGTAAVAFGMTGAQLGWMGGAMLGSVLFPPKMPDGPRLDDLSVQVSGYGASITRLWGTSRIAGNVICSTDLVEHAQEQGGKGGGSYTSYSYTCSFAVSLCEGPITSVRRMWADGKLIYDVSTGNEGLQKGFSASSIVFYTGTETQDVDPTIQMNRSDTPAYRGQAYVVIADLALEHFGNGSWGQAFWFFELPDWPDRAFWNGGYGDVMGLHRVWWGPQVEPASAKLSAIVTDLSLSVGLTADQIDVTDLTDDVFGFVIARQGTARSAVEQLMMAFMFDAVESEGKVKFVKRGRAAALTIDQTDLGVHPAGDPVPTLLALSRADEATLPRTVTIKYPNYAADYCKSRRCCPTHAGRRSRQNKKSCCQGQPKCCRTRRWCRRCACSGGSVFRMIWGEVSAWVTARQDHSQEIERMRLQGELDAAQHARNLEAIRVQADLGVKTIEVQAEAAVSQIETTAWLEAVKGTTRTIGIWFIDAWNGVIRPLVATWAILMISLDFAQGGWVLDDNGWQLCGAALGIYLADRALFKRGK